MYFAYKRLFLLKIGSKERFFNIDLLSSTIHRPPSAPPTARLPAQKTQMQ